MSFYVAAHDTMTVFLILSQKLMYTCCQAEPARMNENGPCGYVWVLCPEPSSNPRPLVRHHHHLLHLLLAAVAHTPCSKTAVGSYRFPFVVVCSILHDMH